LFNNETAEFFRSHDEDMLNNKSGISNFEWVTYPDGKKAYLLTVKSPLFDANNNIIGIVGNSADITLQEQLYQRLKRAQSIAKIGSWEYDIDTDNLLCSEEIYVIYGFSDLNKSLSKDDIYKQVHAEDIKKTESDFQSSIASKKDTAISGNRIIRKKDGELRYVEHRWTIEYDQGRAVKSIGTTQDITELKEKDEMIIRQSRHAAMGEMIGMIAHQWRQPISIISMDANNMLLDIALDNLSTIESENYAKSIVDQTQHLSKTIDDFRNFFKPDKEISKVNIKDVLDKTLSIVKDSLKNNNIEVNLTFDTEKKVNAFERELMQVFVNVINNAKDAFKANKQEDAIINIKVYEDKKYINTDICDNAGGIDRNILHKVFDPYFSTKDEKTGTGLGPYMSKMIIEDHLKGILEVKNKDDGACFTIGLLKKD
jgi:PAS domain S-box-containing protein